MTHTLNINSLKKYAVENGFDKVILRRQNNTFREFCIFLYNKCIQPNRYCVGFDGCFAESDSFTRCIEQAYKYIDDYNENNTRKSA